MTPLVDTEAVSAERALTPADAATVATAMSVEEIERFVQALTAEQVPLLLRRLDQATTLINTAKKVAVIRMLEAGRLDEKWTSPEGEEFTFEQTKRGEFEDIPGLFYVLSNLGASVSDLARCASGARITDLEALATRLEENVRAEALETIKSHRVWKEGSPRLEAMNNPWKRKTKTAEVRERTT